MTSFLIILLKTSISKPSELSATTKSKLDGGLISMPASSGTSSGSSRYSPRRLAFTSLTDDQEADFVLWTDASLRLGLAFVYAGHSFTYAISPSSTKDRIDIFFLEFLAILSAVHHVALFRHPPKKVLLWTDSLDSIAAYSSLQASEPSHNYVLLALAGVLLETGIDLCIRHINGKNNTKADLLSRIMIDEFYCRYPTESVCLFSPPRDLLPVRWRDCF